MVAQGAKVALLDLMPRPGAKDSLADAVKELAADCEGPGHVLGVRGDVSNREELRVAFESAVEHFGAVDVVVANAAASWRSGPLAEMGEDKAWEEAKRTFEVCQFGAFHTCQIAAEYMTKRQEAGGARNGGKIIIIGSIMSLFGSVGRMAYTMAKTSLNTLCTNLARELAPQRVNVNIILPGYIDTPGEHLIASEDQVRGEWTKRGVKGVGVGGGQRIECFRCALTLELNQRR